MMKALSFFSFWLLSGVLAGPQAVYGWNGACYSPVQMAALLAKPKKSGPNTKGLRKQINRLEKGIERAVNRLDDQEGDLAGSLDKQKLGDNPSSVAGQIRSYMEAEQSGWGCDKKTAQLFLQDRHPLLAQSPLLFEMLWQALIPPAWGDASTQNQFQTIIGLIPPAWGDAPTPTKGENNSPPSEPAPVTVNTKAEQCVNSGRLWTNNTCVCPKHTDQWNGKKCVPIEAEKGKDQREENCRKIGRVWDVNTETCKCPDGKILVDGKCLVPGRALCAKAKGMVWRNNKCVPKTKKKMSEKAQCNQRKETHFWDPEEGCLPILQTACANNGGKWRNNTCQCPDNQKWNGKQCIKKKSNNTQETACANHGGAWQPQNNHCQCPGGQKWNGKQCVCPKGQKLNENSNQCVCPKHTDQWDGEKCVPTETPWAKAKDKRAANCKSIGRVWNAQTKTCNCPSKEQKIIRGQCKCPKKGQKLIGGKCQCPTGQVLKSNQCVKPKRASQTCVNMTNGDCVITTTNIDNSTTTIIQNTSQIKNPEDCNKIKGVWDTSTKTCKCPEGHELKNGACLLTCEQGKTLQDGKCIAEKQPPKPCPEWKKHSAFGPNGRVNKSFCAEYARDKRACSKALSRMKKIIRAISKLESRKSRLEDSLQRAELSSLEGSQKKTEAGGLCFSCLKRVLTASQPSTGQQIGNFLTALAGGGIGFGGYLAGKKSQVSANMLRIQQGHPAQSDYYSLMGASAGFPYLAQGLYGMTRANTPVGGWSCSPTASPYGHPHSYQYGQGLNMVYY